MLQVTCIHVKGSVMIMFDIFTYKKSIIKNFNFSHARCIDTDWGHVVVIVHKHTCHMIAS